MELALIVVLIGFLVSIIISPLIIFIVKKLKSEQKVLEYVEAHKEKNGTLTLGGLIFLVGLSITFFIFWDGKCLLSLIALAVTLSFGLLGFLDDFIKIRLKRNLGLKAYQKIIGQVGIALIVSIFIYRYGMIGDEIIIPFFNVSFKIGLWIIPFNMLFFIAVTNAVNLTDGLDGLAGGLSFVVVIFFIPLIYMLIKNNNGLSEYQIAEYKSLMTLCGGMSGGILAFLIYNSNPAKIFMGDTGSLALGGFIASILAFLKMYLLIFIVGFAFVVTILSSFIQIFWFKLTKKRVFKMAPLHHHFELCGLKETKIVSIYLIITILLNILMLILI